MSAVLTLRRLRAFLRLLAAVLFVGTIGELVAAKHYQEPMQLVPFALCGLGLVFLAREWKRPSARTTLTLRAVMSVIALGSLLGVYEHIEGNLGFVRELHPDAAGWTLVQAALTGRDPIGASGVLAVGAALAIAATYATASGGTGEVAVSGSGTGASRRPTAIGVRHAEEMESGLASPAEGSVA